MAGMLWHRLTNADKGSIFRMSTVAAGRISPVTVTVTAADRTIEADVPGAMPVTEVVPALARKLGVLDAAILHGGLRLIAPNGSPLPPERSLADLGIAHGTHLTLEVTLLAPSLVEYDDIVEAVGDVVAREVEPWSPQDGAMTASVVSTGILLVAVIGLAAMASTPVLGYTSLGAAVLILAMASALSMRDRSGPALLTASMSVLFAAVGGYHLVRGVWPQAGYAGAMVGVGIAAAIWGLVGMVAVAARRTYAAAPVLAGVILAVIGAVSWLEPTWARGAWALSLAACAVAANGLPWIALTTARLAVDSPHSDSEIFKIPDEIDAAAVAERYRRGSQWLVTARAAALAVMLCAIPVVAALPTPAGAILCAAALAGLMLGTRSIIDRRDVLLVMTGAALGVLATVLAATGAHPTWRPMVAVVLCAVAVGVVGLTLVAGSRSLRAARIADSAESMCLVAVIPLAVMSAGLVGA